VAFVPVIVMPVKLSATLLLFFTVTFFGSLVLAMPWFPKFNVATESVTGCTPVPDTPTDCGLFAALSVTVRVAVSATAAAGLNVMLIVHEA
jgi:hypothetical protein